MVFSPGRAPIRIRTDRAGSPSGMWWASLQRQCGRGLHPGFYYAGGVDWTFSGLPMHTAATQPPDALMKMRRPAPTGDHLTAQREYANAHWRELIERYKPDVMWNDYSTPEGLSTWRTPADPGFRSTSSAFPIVSATGPDGVINDRFDMFSQRSGKLYPTSSRPSTTRILLRGGMENGR